MPPALGDGWAIAAPSDVGLDAARLSGLDAFLRQWPKHNVHAVVVARRGKLAFEQYFPGRERRWMDWGGVVQFSPTQRHDVRSISKSVVSLLIGTAVSENRFPPLDSPVVDYFPEYTDRRSARKRPITFRHLLTMSHGLRWDENRSWKSRANDERQMNEALIAHPAQGDAVGGHDLHFAIVLPQGKRLPLLNLDEEPVGVEFSDRRFLDKRKLFQPLPYSRHIEEHEGIARTYPGDSENVLLLEFALAHDGHGLDRETQRLGKDVGWFSFRGYEGGVVAAFHRAVGAGGR